MRSLSTCLSTSSLFSTFLFVFFLLLLFVRPAHVGAAHARHPNLVPLVCKSVAANDPNVDYAFCVQALFSVPKSRAASVKELAIVAVKLTRANATATRSFVKRVLKKGKVEDRYLRGCLEDCKQLYSDAASQLSDARRAIKRGRYDDANVWLSAAADAATTCEQGFEDKPRLRDPLRRRNRNMFQLAVIALSITNSLVS